MIEQAIKQSAKELGFSDCKITSVDNINEYKKHYVNFLNQKKQGEMKFLENHLEAKFDSSQILENSKSIILVTLNYFQARKNAINWAPKIHIPSHKEGQIARYAFGRDYHKVFKSKLRLLAKKLNSMNKDSQERFFADSGLILERQAAEKAGIGYIGKNTMLITRDYGSCILNGEIITTQKLKNDKPYDRNQMICGSCNKCQVACPTKALSEDYKIDASKCISYLTIEHKGLIEPKLMEQMGSWIFGCDLCQEVCPHNIRSKITEEKDFLKPIAGESQILKDILQIKTDEEFLEKFKGSPLMRGKRNNLVRNAIIASTNLNRIDLLNEIKELSKNDNPVIQKTAEWSLSKFLTS